MMLKLYEVKCNVDDGWSRGETTKKIFSYTPESATEFIINMYKNEGDLVTHISTYEIELHDGMILS